MSDRRLYPLSVPSRRGPPLSSAQRAALAAKQAQESGQRTDTISAASPLQPTDSTAPASTSIDCADPQRLQRLLTRALHKEQAADRRHDERANRPTPEPTQQPQPQQPAQQLKQQTHETEPRLQAQTISEEAKQQETAQPLQQQQLQQHQPQLRPPSPQPAAPVAPHSHAQAEPQVQASTLSAPQRSDPPQDARQLQQPRSEAQPAPAEPSDSHRQRQREHSQKIALQLQQQQDEVRSYQQRLHQRAASRDDERVFRQEQQRRMHAASHLVAKPSPHLTPMLHQAPVPMHSQASSSRSHAAYPQLQPMHMAPQPFHPLEHLGYDQTGLIAPLTYSDLHRHEAAQQQQQQLMHHSASAGMIPRVPALLSHSQSASYLPSWSPASDLQLQAENDALIMQQQYRLQLAHQQEQQALELRHQQQAALQQQALQQQRQQALMRQQFLAAQAVASYPTQLAPVAFPQPQPLFALPPPPPPQAAPVPPQPAAADAMAQLTNLLLAQLLAAQANGGPSSLHSANLLAQGARLPPVSARVHPTPQPAASGAAAVGKKKKTQVGWTAAVAPPQRQQANAIQLGGDPETRSLSADLVIAQTRQDAAMSKHVQRAAQRKLAEAAHAAAIAAEEAAAKAKRDADFNKRLMAQRRAQGRLDAGHERVKAAALTAEVAQMHSLGLIGDGSAARPFKFPGPHNGQPSQSALGSQEPQQARQPQPYIDQPMHRTPAAARTRAHARDRPRSPRSEPKPRAVALNPPRLYAASPSPARKPRRQTEGPANFMRFSGGGHAAGTRGLLGVFSTYEADRSIPGRGQQMTWIQKWTLQQRQNARKGRQGMSPLRALKADGGAASPPRFRDPSEFKPRQRSESVQPPNSTSKAEGTNHRTQPRSRPRSHSPPRTQRSARKQESSPRSRAGTPPRPKQELEAAVAVSPVKIQAPVPSPVPLPQVVVDVPAPVVAAIAAPSTPVAAAPKPAQVQLAASASMQDAHAEHSNQLAAKQDAHSAAPEAEHSPMKAAVVAPAVVSTPPPPPSQPTPPPPAVLRSPDDLLSATTAHASMFPESSGGIVSAPSPLQRELGTASSSSPSGSQGPQGLTEFHKLIQQKSVAQRVVHEDGTDEIITTTTTVHRNSTAANSRTVSGNAPTKHNVTSSVPPRAVAAAITEQALIRRANSVIHIPAGSDAVNESEEVVSADVDARALEHEQDKEPSEDMPNEQSERLQSAGSDSNSSTERERTSPALVAAAAAAGSDLASRGKLWQAPSPPDARRPSALVKPHLWDNPATNQTVSAVLKNSTMSDEDKQAFLANNANQRHVIGSKSNPLLRPVHSTLTNPPQQKQRRPSNVMAGVGADATPIVPQRRSPQPSAAASNHQPVSSSRSPHRSPAPSAKAQSKPKVAAAPSAKATKQQAATAGSKYQVVVRHRATPLKEEEEKQQQQHTAHAFSAVASAQAPPALVAASSDDSDLSIGDYSDDAFTALSARDSDAATNAVAAVTKTAESVSPPPSKTLPRPPRFDPARTSSSIHSEARYSDDEYAEESVQESIASPRSSMAADAAADPEQSVEEEDFTL